MVTKLSEPLINFLVQNFIVLVDSFWMFFILLKQEQIRIDILKIVRYVLIILNIVYLPSIFIFYFLPEVRGIPNLLKCNLIFIAPKTFRLMITMFLELLVVKFLFTLSVVYLDKVMLLVNTLLKIIRLLLLEFSIVITYFIYSSYSDLINCIFKQSVLYITDTFIIQLKKIGSNKDLYYLFIIAILSLINIIILNLSKYYGKKYSIKSLKSNTIFYFCYIFILSFLLIWR